MNLPRSVALLVLAACAPLDALTAALTPVVIGHEYRQDDLPAIAAAADGSLWAAWLSFAGDRDDIAIRRYRNGKWENLQWVPGASGDPLPRRKEPRLGVGKRNIGIDFPEDRAITMRQFGGSG